MAISLHNEAPTPADIDVRTAGGLERVIDVPWIAQHLRKAAALLATRDGVQTHRISALIVDDARMTHLHERHTGLAETTDVLTFDLRDDPSQPINADIVICADEAGRRAAQLHHSIERELLLYCVHGLLHCAGYDDHASSEWTAMHEREDEILKAIGVGAIFHAPRHSDETESDKEDRR